MNASADTPLVSSLASVVEALRSALEAGVTRGGRLDREALDARQPEAFTLARVLGETEAVRSLDRFARSSRDPLDRELATVYAAMVARSVLAQTAFLAPCQQAAADLLAAHGPEVAATLGEANLGRIAAMMRERRGLRTGSYGLEDAHEEIRATFARFADERIAPLAEHIHRHDDILPEDLLKELAELGVFGISIPEEYGGSHVDNLTMCLATEELSRGSLGAGGSVITRPEICAKALLKGGSDDQKAKWLPAIAAGEKLVSVAVTEPNAGSDVAAVRVTATPVEGGWRIDGEKTWCTFAGRADVFILLARTGALDEGARGLTLFLVEKPAKISADDHHAFHYEQPGGGTIEGHAIPTIGYRGMHSFTVTFDQWFVPDANRVGDVGQGFALQMEGFAGGRIQTAARAVGVMEQAFRAAWEYAAERQVFGRPLATFSMSESKLVQMAAMIAASRQFSYEVARLMDEGKGGMEASLVKLVSCRDAEWVTREAMQLHGGMGYSQEYAVSRYWQDARVLSIFEGAEEVLAVYVVARQLVGGTRR